MAEYATLEEVLDYRTLVSRYSNFSRAKLDTNLFFKFYTPKDVRNYYQDQAEWITLGDIRDPAPLNKRNAPAHKVDPEGMGRASATVLHMFNSMNHGMDALLMLRDPENWVLQNRGKQVLDQQMEYFAARHSLTKMAYMSQAMTSQTIYIDANDNVRTSNPSSGYQVATGIANSHVGQIDLSNFGSSGNAIDVAWDDPAAKILNQLDYIRLANEYEGNEPLRHIWLYRQNKKWIRDNDQILEFFGAGQERLDRALMADEFEIDGWLFHFYGGTWTEATGGSGTRRPYISETKAVITPEVGDWLMGGNGVQLVPATIDIVEMMPTAIGNWSEVFGDFSYVVPDHNPPSLTHYMGSNWMFALKNPDSIFVPTVDF